MSEMRARDAGQDLTNDRACRFPSVLQALQARNDREYEPEPEPVPSGQSQSQRRLISHSVGVDRRFLFYIRGDSRTASAPSLPYREARRFFICPWITQANVGNTYALASFASSRCARRRCVTAGASLRPLPITSTRSRISRAGAFAVGISSRSAPTRTTAFTTARPESSPSAASPGSGEYPPLDLPRRHFDRSTGVGPSFRRRENRGRG